MALAINLAKASYYDDDNDTKLIKICKKYARSWQGLVVKQRWNYGEEEDFIKM